MIGEHGQADLTSMKPERYAPDDPREWLRRARSALTLARSVGPEILLELLCCDAQRAAEQAIKALLIVRNVAFPYTQDLAELLEVLEADGVPVPPDVGEAHALTRYAAAVDYPGAAGPVSEQDYERARAVAERVVRWAEGLVSHREGVPERPAGNTKLTAQRPQAPKRRKGTGALPPDLLTEMVRRIVELAQPERIILFGSAARGEMGPDSDVDLLVIKRGEYSRRGVQVEIYRSLAGIGVAKDVIVATPEDVERYRDSYALVFYPAQTDMRDNYVRAR